MSCFSTNMAVKQNAIELTSEYPLAAEVVHKSFYVDDGLTGADNVESAITIQRQLQDLFTRGGFLLRNWNSSDPRVLQAIWRLSCMNQGKSIPSPVWNMTTPKLWAWSGTPLVLPIRFTLPSRTCHHWKLSRRQSLSRRSSTFLGGSFRQSSV